MAEAAPKQIRIDGSMVIFMGLLFVTSAISGGISIQQARIANRSAKAAQDAAEAAKTSADAAKAEAEPIIHITDNISAVRSHGKILINVGFENLGKTAAQDVHIGMNARYLRASPMLDEYVLTNDQFKTFESSSVVLPVSTNLASPTFHKLFDPVDLPARLTQETGLYIWGKVHYTDFDLEFQDRAFCVYIPTDKSLEDVIGSTEVEGAKFNAPYIQCHSKPPNSISP